MVINASAMPGATARKLAAPASPRPDKSIHNAPDSAKQSDEGRNRGDGGKPGHPFFQVANFFACGHLHLYSYGVGIFQIRSETLAAATDRVFALPVWASNSR